MLQHGVESRNSVGGTGGLMCQQFAKKTIRSAETFPCSSVKHDAFPEITVSQSFCQPEVERDLIISSIMLMLQCSGYILSKHFLKKKSLFVIHSCLVQHKNQLP